MLPSILLGALAGSRSLAPLAILSADMRLARAPREPLGALLSNPALARLLGALAVGELLGDKWRRAPDRIVPAGMAARVLSAALAGWAVAPPAAKGWGAALSVATALVSAHLTFRARLWAMRRWGQTSTGLVEDALVLLASRAVVDAANASGRRPRFSRRG